MFRALSACLCRGGFVAWHAGAYSRRLKWFRSSFTWSRESVVMLTGKGLSFNSFGLVSYFTFLIESLKIVYSVSRVANSLISFRRTGLNSDSCSNLACSLISYSKRLFTSRMVWESKSKAEDSRLLKSWLRSEDTVLGFDLVWLLPEAGCNLMWWVCVLLIDWSIFIL